MPQQEQDFMQKWKRNLNLTCFVCTAFQRAIVVPIRSKFGREALGMPCVWGFLALFLWWVCTADPLLFYYMLAWIVCWMWRVIEANRVKREVVSDYDGRPNNLGSNERMAKIWYEPIIIGILGLMALKWYQDQGWRPYGVPYFLLTCAFSCKFVAWAGIRAWDKQIQAMNDGELINRIALREFEDQYRK